MEQEEERNCLLATKQRVVFALCGVVWRDGWMDGRVGSAETGSVCTPKSWGKGRRLCCFLFVLLLLLLLRVLVCPGSRLSFENGRFELLYWVTLPKTLGYLYL